jgi:hypothetical protein
MVGLRTGRNRKSRPPILPKPSEEEKRQEGEKSNCEGSESCGK